MNSNMVKPEKFDHGLVYHFTVPLRYGGRRGEMKINMSLFMEV